MNEFDVIARYFSPLAAGDNAALGLKDDAALLHPLPGHELVITKDAIVAGVHFTGNEHPGLIARKCLRMNLSDLAAMGAAPYGYFLALMLPQTIDSAWLQSFAQGLRADQECYGITLLGGDTTRTCGPLSMSITALGYVPQGQALKRSGAMVKDDVYITGTLGDAALGLRVAKNELPTSSAMHQYLLDRYQLPEPRVKLGQALRNVATSCIDISDGLVQDLEHICECSKVGATIYMPFIALSDAAQSLLPSIKHSHEVTLTGGDDYELLFTAPQDAAMALQALSAQLGVPVTRIGTIDNGQTVSVMDTANKPISLSRKGYSHF